MKKDAEPQKVGKPEKKVDLERIERIAVIVGAMLGVVAFFWQVYDRVISQQEKVDVAISFLPISKDRTEAINSEFLNAHIEIINIGSRPIYMNSVYIEAQIKDRQQALNFSDSQFTIDSDPIEPGARRRYNIAIDPTDIVQMDYFVTFSKIFLVVKSSMTELYKQDITKCYKESADQWKSYSSLDSSFQFLTYMSYFPYQCSQ